MFKHTLSIETVPEGSPQIIQASNMNSSNSIKLAWLPPPNNTINGELVGFKITYRPRDQPQKETEITLENSNIQVNLHYFFKIHFLINLNLD